MSPRTPAVAMLALVLSASIAGCNLGHSSTATTTATTVPATTTPASTTSPPATTASPTTTVYKPTNVQTSPDDAAARLIATWADGDRHGAGQIATPSAVATLFAVHYPSGGMDPRGCTYASVNPGTCTYADLATGTLYSLGVVEVGTDWYVSTVTIET